MKIKSFSIFVLVLAVAGGLAMTIIESFLSHRSFGKRIEGDLVGLRVATAPSDSAVELAEIVGVGTVGEALLHQVHELLVADAEQDLIDIEAYLVQGAADSERPMTCG